MHQIHEKKAFAVFRVVPAFRGSSSNRRLRTASTVTIVHHETDQIHEKKAFVIFRVVRVFRGSKRQSGCAKS